MSSKFLGFDSAARDTHGDLSVSRDGITQHYLDIICIPGVMWFTSLISAITFFALNKP